MNVVISWTGLTGYTGANWRALQTMPDVRVKAFVERTGMDQEFRADRELAGLDVRVLAQNEIPSQELEDDVAAFAPDVVFVVGWRAKSCRWFAAHSRWERAKKVLVCDMPFAWSFRKILARLVLAPYLRRFDAAFVPGRVPVRYMRWLGFGGKRPVFTGLNSTDLKRFDVVAPRRDASRRRFLFVGRYAEEKGLDVLMTAYERYRMRVDAPWELDCVGTGSCAELLRNRTGVHDLGFMPPDDLAAVYLGHDAFVLPSRFEPWGLVLAEAAGVGLPIICTDVCGAVGEVVRDNGLVVRAGDATALTDAMERLHRMSDATRSEMGAKGRDYARPFSCEAWAQRVVEMCRKLTGRV